MQWRAKAITKVKEGEARAGVGAGVQIGAGAEVGLGVAVLVEEEVPTTDGVVQAPLGLDTFPGALRDRGHVRGLRLRHPIDPEVAAFPPIVWRRDRADCLVSYRTPLRGI